MSGENTVTGKFLNNRIIALIFRCAVMSSSGAGLFILTGAAGWRINWVSLVFYTNLSNLACLVFYACLCAKTAIEIKNGGITGKTVMLPRFKGAIIMMLTVTMLIYHFMLAATGFVMEINIDPSYMAANTLLHYIAPCLCLAEWLLFDKKNAYKRFDPLLWLTVPFVYLIFVLIRAEIGGPLAGTYRYPYFFLNVDALGISGVLTYVVILMFVFAFLGYIIYFIDKLIYTSEKRARFYDRPSGK